MELIKCDKCEQLKDKFFCYNIQMPVVYGCLSNKLTICSQCFRRMWDSFPSGERGVINYDKRIFDRAEE